MEKRKCAAGAATPDSANALQCGGNIRLNNIVAHSEAQSKSLIDLLPRGKAHAVSMAHLADYFGVSEREARKMVHRARCEGAIIAAERSLSGFKVQKAARQQLRALEGQQSLDV